jgi:hypothetical protein
MGVELLSRLPTRTPSRLPSHGPTDGVGGWWPSGSALAFEFDNQRGFNSIDRTKTTPDSILTYTSPSPKLVYGDDGVLGYAPHNLLTYSEQFDVINWTKSTSGTGTACIVTPNAGVAPDGTATADRAQFDRGANNTVSDVSTLQGPGAALSAVANTFSVWLKSYDGTTQYLRMSISGASIATKTITADWQRFDVTWVSTGGTFFPRLQVLGATGLPQMADVLVWGAQINIGPTALTYIPTTTAAVYSLPIDHNPTTFEPLGVLIEEQRVNLQVQSQTIGGTGWSLVSSCTATLNSAVAPDGTTTMSLLIGSASDSSRAQSQAAITISAATSYTASVYLKAGTSTLSRVAVFNGGVTVALGSVTIDWAAGVPSTSASSGASNITYTDGGNGIYRLSFTVASGAETSAVLLLYPDRNAVSATVYVWGAQLEGGAFPSSYIPTQASQVTRAADQVSIATSAFGYNAVEGTVAVEAQVPSDVDGGVGNYFWSLSDGTNSNLIHVSEVNSIRSQIITAGVVQFDTSVGAEPATGVFIKAALGFASNDVRLARDGTLGTADTVATMPLGITTLRVGLRGDAIVSTTLNGHIKRLTYFPTRRTDADLQVLST